MGAPSRGTADKVSAGVVVKRAVADEHGDAGPDAAVDDDDGDFAAEGLSDAADDFGVGVGIGFGDHCAVEEE